MTISRQILALAAIGVALAACETAGQGPVTLSRTAASAFDQYKEVDFPHKAFAISEDGQEFMYMWCEYTACAGSLAGETVYSCDQRRRKEASSDRPCRILAVGNTVVWNGEITYPDTVAAYRLNAAEGVTLAGPAASIGAIIYAPGNRADTDLPADDNSVPIYVSALQARGWDAFKAVTSNDQLLGTLGHRRAAEGLAKHIADLRAAGYKRVVMAGQSFGSWVSLVGGANPETWADANIAAVPSCCGPREWQGEINDRFERNRTELRPVLRDLKTPTILIFFDGDDLFDPGGRGAVATAALERNGIAHRVIDQPFGLRGHSAAWSVQFDYAFGECIADFAAGDTETTACNVPDLADVSYLWSKEWTDPNRFAASRATEDQLRAHIGNTIVGYHKGGPRAAYYLRSETETIAQLRRGYEPAREVVIASSIEGSRLCLDKCYTIYHWSQDRDFVAALDEDGNVAFQGTILKGNLRNIGVAGPSS